MDHGVNVLGVAKWIIAAVMGMWNGMSTTVHILLGLQFLDFATGLSSAFVRGTIDTEISSRGIIRKGMMWVLIYVCHLVSLPLGSKFDLGEALTVVYIINETLSIVENCAKAGLSVPPFVLQAMAQARSVVPKEPTQSSVTTIIQSETTVIPPASKVVEKSEKKPEGDA